MIVVQILIHDQSLKAASALLTIILLNAVAITPSVLCFHEFKIFFIDFGGDSYRDDNQASLCAQA